MLEVTAVNRSVARLIASLLLAMAAGTTTAASAVTLTFDELPFQPVDGLSFQGVTFDFKIDGTDSLDAYYNSFGPGDLTTIQDPSLTGNSAGILTLDFDVPTPALQFGAALGTGESLAPGCVVELFAIALESLGTTSVDTMATSGPLGFSEALFESTGTPIVRAVIDFADDPGSFALDNLRFIPEPSVVFLSLIAFALLMLPVRSPCPRPSQPQRCQRPPVGPMDRSPCELTHYLIRCCRPIGCRKVR